MKRNLNCLQVKVIKAITIVIVFLNFQNIVFSQTCYVPSNVTASPSSLSCGNSSSLNATATGNSIAWYTVSTGGTPIGTSASGA